MLERPAQVQDLSFQVTFQQLARDFCGAADVLFVRLTQGGNVLGQCCVTDSDMFGVDVAPGAAVNPGQVAIALVLVVQNLVEAHQPRGFATRDEGEVEFSVAYLPLVDVWFFLHFRLGQVMKGGDNSGLPLIIAVFHTLGECHAFENYSQVGDVFQFGGRHVGHTEAPLPLYLYKPIGTEAVEGFPQGSRTYFISALEELDTEFVTRLEPTVDYVLAQSLVGLVSESCRFHVVLYCASGK